MKFYYETMPRYIDFDKMGILHNSKYAVLFEEGRLAMSASAGYSAEEMEKHHIYMVISEAKYCYKKPIRYNEKVTVELWVVYIKTYSIKIAFRITKDNGATLCAEGYSLHASFNTQTESLCEIPERIVSMWAKYKDDEQITC